MDAIISIAKKLDLANMNFTLVFILAGLFIAFIYVIFKCLIQQFCLKIITKEKVKLRFLLIPSTLSLVLNVGLLFFSYFLLTKFNVDVISVLEGLILRFDYNVSDLVIIIITFFVIEIMYILISAIIYKLKNFNLWYYIKLLFFKLKKDEETVLFLKSNKAEPEKLAYTQGLLACLFSFVMIFFIAIILFYIGTILGKNVFINIEL